MTTTNVPTNGFNAPPAAGAPAVPPSQPSGGGFNVPPAGPPARTPGNGEPIVHAGQTPGYLQQNPALTPGQQPAAVQQPAGTQPQGADLASLIAALQASVAPALPGTQTQTPTETVLPSWAANGLAEFDLNSVEDPIIRSMASILQTTGKGLDLDRVLGRALAYGDPALIDRAYLAEKGGANGLQLAEIAAGIVQAVNAKSDAITNAVHASVGGEANWNAASAAFNASAPQELKVVVAAMLDSTKESQINAASALVANFARASGLLPQAGAALLNGASGAFTGQGLGKAEFQSELAKLNPNARGYTEAREALFTRRSLGKRSGL